VKRTARWTVVIVATIVSLITCILITISSSFTYGSVAANGTLTPTAWVYLPYVSRMEPPPTPTPTLTPTSTPTPTPSATPVLPVGASIYFDVWKVTITGAERVDHLEGDSGSVYPSQIFVIALTSVENLGYVSDNVSRYDLKVRDSIGRQFDMADLEAQWAAEDQYDRTGVYYDIQPGFVEDQVYAFDVGLDSEGLELIAVVSPVTPTPNPTPSPTVGLGTPGRFDDWQYTITDVTITHTLNGDYGDVTSKGVFLVVFATVQNLGLESDYISRYDFVTQDSSTRQFDMADLNAQWAAEDQFGRTGVYHDIQPSFIEDQVYVFDVLPESSGLYFVPTNPGDAVDLGR